jgi:hypothetical protein
MYPIVVTKTCPLLLQHELGTPTATTVARIAIALMIAQLFVAVAVVRHGTRSLRQDGTPATVVQTDSHERDPTRVIVTDVTDQGSERRLTTPSTTEAAPTPLAGLRVPTNLRDVLLLLAETQRVMMVTIDSYHHQS